MEKLRVNEYRTYIINLKSKIYSIYSKIYLPETFKLKYVIKYAAYSTLKGKSMTFYCHHIGCFSFSSSHKLSSYRVNKAIALVGEPGILLPLQVWSWFLHFLYKAALHSWIFYLGWSDPLFRTCADPINSGYII